MRGILIDPFTREITEVDTDGKFTSTYSLLGVELITVVNVGQSDALFLDDEGLFVPAQDQAYFQWAGSQQPFAGRGLILGTDEEGDSTDAKISLEMVRAKISWLDNTKINPDDYLEWTITTF